MAATHTQLRSDASTGPVPAAERSEIATMLPEPGQIGGAMSSGDADDLISKLADAEIDKLMADDDAGVSSPASSTPSAAPSPPPVDPLADLERSVEAADAVEAAITSAEPEVPAALPEALVEAHVEQSVPADFANGALSDDASAVAAELAADDRLHQRTIDAPHESAAPEPGIDTNAPLPVSATEPTPEELAALREPLPGVDPMPVPAAEPIAEAPVIHPTIGELAAAEATKADDEHMAPDEVAPSRFAALTALPFAVLDAINYPVRNLSDKARESLGVVAIVTVVNAIGLIAYRAFFAHH